MQTKALVVIDIQNDITKHYRDIVDNINAVVDLKKLPEMLAYYAKQGCEVITFDATFCLQITSNSQKLLERD